MVTKEQTKNRMKAYRASRLKKAGKSIESACTSKIGDYVNCIFNTTKDLQKPEFRDSPIINRKLSLARYHLRELLIAENKDLSLYSDILSETSQTI
jgi:hypothetical protein